MTASAAVSVEISPESHDALMAVHAHSGRSMVSGKRLPSGRVLVRLDPDVYEGLLLVDEDIDRAIARVLVRADSQGGH